MVRELPPDAGSEDLLLVVVQDVPGG